MIDRRRATVVRPTAPVPQVRAEFFVTCPGCNAVLAVPERALGRRRKCPVCGGGLKVPANRHLLREVPEDFQPKITGAAERFLQKQAGEAPSLRVNSGRRTALVVDDSRHVREVAARILTSVGFHVETVGNGAAALAWATAQTPELVLVDTVMPGIDGYEVCRRLRELPGLAEVPIVLVGGDNATICRLHARMAGATTGLPKPCGAELLLATVAEITGGRG